MTAGKGVNKDRWIRTGSGGMNIIDLPVLDEPDSGSTTQSQALFDDFVYQWSDFAYIAQI